MLFNCTINNNDKAPDYLISHYDTPLACVCACVDTLMHVCLCVCLCVYMCMCVCACMCVFVCVYVCLYFCVCIYLYVCVFMSVCVCVYMSSDFGKPTKLSHLVFQEILILNIQSTVIPLCYIVAMPYTYTV